MQDSSVNPQPLHKITILGAEWTSLSTFVGFWCVSVWHFCVSSEHSAKHPQPPPPPRQHSPLLTSVLHGLSAQQPGSFRCGRGQQWASGRGVLQQHLQLLQLRVSVQRGERLLEASQRVGDLQGGQEKLRFGRCHLFRGRRARGCRGCEAQPLLELLSTGLLLHGDRVLRSCTPRRRGGLAGQRLLLLRLFGAVMLGGSQCWRVFRSGVPVQKFLNYYFRIFVTEVIRESKQHQMFVSGWCFHVWTVTTWTWALSSSFNEDSRLYKDSCVTYIPKYGRR